MRSDVNEEAHLAQKILNEQVFPGLRERLAGPGSTEGTQQEAAGVEIAGERQSTG